MADCFYVMNASVKLSRYMNIFLYLMNNNDINWEDGYLFMKNIYKNIILWLTGGIAYFYMEIAFRGYSHYSMLICGGTCFLLVGYAGRHILKNSRSIIGAVAAVMASGMMIITAIEFITGVLVNLVFDLQVWDYSGQKYNVMGQICLLYSALWSLLSLLCVYLDIVIRKYIFDETINQT